LLSAVREVFAFSLFDSLTLGANRMSMTIDRSKTALFGLALAAAMAAGLAAIDPPPAAPGEKPSFFAGLLSIGRERLVAPLPPAPDSYLPENAWLAINERGLDVIRRSEGLRLKSYYLAGQWLVGYGHAATARKDMTITVDHADDLLISDVRRAEEGVRRLVKVPLNENEFSALVSLAYNMGVGAFEKTEVLRRLNAGDRRGAAEAFRYLVAADIKGERVVLAALKRRREDERALFLTRPLRA
jgi:lysozyme